MRYCNALLNCTLRTPTSGRKRGAGPLEPDTPLSTRKRVKASLVRISEAVESKEYSEESESGEVGLTVGG